jgi:site-specific recombinase XerD
MDDVARWVTTISVDRKPNSVRLYVVRVRVVLKYARTVGYKAINPELIPIPKREDTCRTFLTPDEVSKMIDCAFDIRNKFIISILYSSGIRVSELCSLRKDAIVDRQFMVIGKGKKARLCFIDGRTEQLMIEYLKTRKDHNDKLIVSHLYRKGVTKGTIELVVKNTAHRAGIYKQVTPHVLRHSFATNFIRNNGSIKYLSVMLGHSSMDTTSIYTHVVDNDLKNQYDKFHSV